MHRLMLGYELEHVFSSRHMSLTDNSVRYPEKRTGIRNDEAIARFNERTEVRGKHRLGSLNSGIRECAEGSWHKIEGPRMSSTGA